MTRRQVPGVAIGIVKDGELVYAKGFGVTELGGDEPVTPESIFSMGSIAKSSVGWPLCNWSKKATDHPVRQRPFYPYSMADSAAEEAVIRRCDHA